MYESSKNNGVVDTTCLRVAVSRVECRLSVFPTETSLFQGCDPANASPEKSLIPKSGGFLCPILIT